jgi:copper(I)-binding protein
MLTLGAAFAFGSLAHAGDVAVSGAFARASAFSGAKAGSAYLTITNQGTEADRLVGLKTDVAGKASLHETVMEDGVMSMHERQSLDFAPGASVDLSPSGTHVMLTGLKAPLQAGATFKLTLVFEKAGEVTVDVPVGAVGATEPAN